MIKIPQVSVGVSVISLSLSVLLSTILFLTVNRYEFVPNSQGYALIRVDKWTGIVQIHPTGTGEIRYIDMGKDLWWKGRAQYKYPSSQYTRTESTSTPSNNKLLDDIKKSMEKIK